MATFSKEPLSGATDGRNVKITTTATPGNLIHTAHATAQDEIWLWVVNYDSADRRVTVEFGGTTAPDDLIEMTIPFGKGLVPIVPGLVLTNGVVVRVFCASANVTNVNGFVNRITA